MDKNKLARLPLESGVYLFKDQHHHVIYIGKAKSIRKRVRSYFQDTVASSRSKSGPNPKLRALVEEIVDVAFVVTKNEQEALLLEAQLVKQHQPRFNVLLKFGAPFIYLLFTDEAVPQLELARDKRKKGTYFGPFLHKTPARRAYAYLLKTFRLKLCNKKIAGGCLDFHLDLCPGNCTGQFDENAYRFRMNLAQQALAGDHKAFLRLLKAQITKLSVALQFEKARNLQEYVENFESIFHTLKTHFTEHKYDREVAHATTRTSYSAEHAPHAAAQLQHMLNLPHPPRTIDCFDISHFQSRSIVGSCIRFVDGKPEKNKFRRFKITSLIQQNDYAALREIVSRRYKKIDDLPDLIVIDGGKGQLHAVEDIVPHIPMISLAKPATPGVHRDQSATLFQRNDSTGMPIDVKTDAGKLLLALRDYAHHFAVSYHTVRQKKAIF
jgi:excinuclease ABC subunit C